MANVSFTVTYVSQNKRHLTCNSFPHPPNHTPKQSRNWDGGGQERDTAISCIHSIFGTDAAITPNCVDVYPVKVIVTAHIGSTSVVVWQGRQQDLFSKYADRRAQAMEEMKSSLMELKDDVM